MREKASSFVRFEEILGEQIQTFLLALNESCLLLEVEILSICSVISDSFYLHCGPTDQSVNLDFTL